jgi:UDP-N-acetylmuramoyl-L-alanyl-D-glutamate--2,6-diaminopimelate ligase
VLWSSLKPTRVSIVNGDDEYGARIKTAPGTGKVTFGQRTGDYCFDIIKNNLNGMEYSIRVGGRLYVGHTQLVGVHNLYNICGVLAALAEMKISLYDSIESLKSFVGVPGRLQRVPNNKSRHVFIDYAHTDDALRNVLSALTNVRESADAKSRMITVFGCGGDRDAGKRPLMAKAAEHFSDLVIVTSDNPRTEDPQAIIDGISAGFENPNKVKKIVDRREAIRYAIEVSQEDDIILIAGKGHEDYQIVGSQKLSFRDDMVAAEYLK